MTPTPLREAADALVSNAWVWYFLVTVVPCLGLSLADAQLLPQGRRQAGDRHLKFHDSRDNLGTDSIVLPQNLTRDDNPKGPFAPAEGV